MIAPYPLWLLVYYAVPIALLEVFAYKHLRPYHRIYPVVAGVCIIIGSLWDLFADVTGIWWWPAGCCWLPRVATIPLEEIFFMALSAIYIAQLTIIVRDIVRSHHRLSRKDRSR